MSHYSYFQISGGHLGFQHPGNEYHVIYYPSVFTTLENIGIAVGILFLGAM